MMERRGGARTGLAGIVVLAAVTTGMAAPGPSPPVGRPAVPATALQSLSPGDRVHMTGCMNGRLMALRIDIYAEPPGTISSWVARLRGTSRERICDGEVVIVKEVRRVRGDVAVLVEPLDQDVAGWVDSRFVGTHFPLYRCHTRFEEEALVEKCLHGEPSP